MRFPIKKRFVIPLVVVATFAIVYVAICALSFSRSENIYGVSFDPEYAGYLALDPQKVFQTILDEWHFRYVRLPAHWNKVEPLAGQYNFQELDTLMQKANLANAKVMIALGQKTPRWPECHLPPWSKELAPGEYRQALNEYIKAVVERYKNNPALETWQVENEPFLAFGEQCPAFSQQNLQEEIALVKSIDQQHLTITTDSGELSSWVGTANAADLFGTTLYRVVWNKYAGYFNYDWLPVAFYRTKLWFVGRSPESSYVVELQAEPWIANKQIDEMPLSEQYKSMDIVRLKKNITYAENLGLSRNYLWGAEWWYWLREKGIMEIPNFIATLNK